MAGVGKGRTGVLVAEALGSPNVHQWVGDWGCCLGHGHGSGAVQKNAASEVTGPHAARQRTKQQKIGLHGFALPSS